MLKFVVRSFDEGYESYINPYTTTSPWEAARLWASDVDWCKDSYAIADGREVTVEVENTDTGEKTVLVVAGEMVPSYFAWEKT